MNTEQSLAHDAVARRWWKALGEGEMEKPTTLAAAIGALVQRHARFMLDDPFLSQLTVACAAEAETLQRPYEEIARQRDQWRTLWWKERDRVMELEVEVKLLRLALEENSEKIIRELAARSVATPTGESQQ